jgi:hypothetical protein
MFSRLLFLIRHEEGGLVFARNIQQPRKLT